MKNLEARQREMRERISQELAKSEIPVADDSSPGSREMRRINYQYLEVISKLKAAQSGIEDALQLVQSLAERSIAQKHRGQKEAPEPPSLAVQSNDAGALLDTKAAAAYLGVAPSFVKCNYRKNIPCILIGSGEKRLRVRFRRCDLDVWIQKHRVGR